MSPLHTCPGPGCVREVSYDQLMCPGHWRQVPKPIQTAVWRAWNNGEGAGSAAHTQAMEAAIRSLEER